ncbi:MAG: hypothetical protein ACI906_000474 [Candidatus Latescibacterota bacterium]|jgi:hypothetical protein
MTSDLRQIYWMRSQWKRFRHILWGSTGAAWLVCCAGIILLGHEQFLLMLALVFMFLVVTGLFIYLLIVIRRELKALEREAIEVRAAQNLPESE